MPCEVSSPSPAAANRAPLVETPKAAESCLMGPAHATCPERKAGGDGELLPQAGFGHWNTLVIEQIERIDTAFAIASVKLSYGKNSQDRARSNGVGRSSCAGTPQNRNRAAQTASGRGHNTGRYGRSGCGSILASTGGNCGLGLLILGDPRLPGWLPRRRLAARGTGTASARAIVVGQAVKNLRPGRRVPPADHCQRFESRIEVPNWIVERAINNRPHGGSSSTGISEAQPVGGLESERPGREPKSVSSPR
jgi:hypothetical protein